jgi:hypothetical protein
MKFTQYCTWLIVAFPIIISTLAIASADNSNKNYQITEVDLVEIDVKPQQRRSVTSIHRSIRKLMGVPIVIRSGICSILTTSFDSLPCVF